MSSRLRRSLVLTTLLALLLGLAGAAAPSGLAANPTNTTIAGIDVDATTIPQLEQLMNSHRLNAVDLTNFYLAAHPPAQPDAARGDHRQPDGARRRTSGRRRRGAAATTVHCSGFRSS